MKARRARAQRTQRTDNTVHGGTRTVRHCLRVLPLRVQRRSVGSARVENNNINLRPTRRAGTHDGNRCPGLLSRRTQGETNVYAVKSPGDERSRDFRMLGESVTAKIYPIVSELIILAFNDVKTRRIIVQSIFSNVFEY